MCERRSHPGVLLVEAQAVAAGQLGLAHRPFGVAQQFVGAAAVAGRERDAHAAGQREGHTVELPGLGHGAQHPFGCGLGGAGVDMAQQQRKLVAADAGHGIALAQHAAQPVGHLAQRPVAHLVAQAVVDVAEAVQVQHQQRKGVAIVLQRAGRLFHLLGEPAAVGQTGQVVGAGQGFQPLVGGQAIAEVAEGPHAAQRPAPAPQRPGHTFQHLAGEQRQPFGGGHQGGLLQAVQAALVGLRVLHHAPHPVVHGGVVVLAQQVLGHRPQLGEAAVEGAHTAAQVGDEDAVGRGLQRGLQLGHRIFLRRHGGLPAADVQQCDQAVRRRARTGCHQRLDGAPQLQRLAIWRQQHGVRQQLAGRAVCGFVPVGVVFQRAQQLVGRRGPQRGLVQAQQARGGGVAGDHPQRRQGHDPGGVGQRLHQGPPGGHGGVFRARHRQPGGFGHGAHRSGSAGVSGSKKYATRGRGAR